MTKRGSPFEQEGYDKQQAELPATKLELYVLMRTLQNAVKLELLKLELLKHSKKDEMAQMTKDVSNKMDDLFEGFMRGLITNKGRKIVDRDDG